MSAVNEYKLVLVQLGPSCFPGEYGAIKNLEFDYSSHPAMYPALNSGWSPISHTVTVVDDGLLLTIFMQRTTTATDLDLTKLEGA